MPIDSDLTLSASIQSVGICAFQNAHKSITVMNASCQLNTGALGTPFQIYGYNNSTAQTYATEGNIPFTALDTRDALPGDVTLDGNVTLADAVFLQKYLESVWNLTMSSSPTVTATTMVLWMIPIAGF